MKKKSTNRKNGKRQKLKRQGVVEDILGRNIEYKGRYNPALTPAERFQVGKYQYYIQITLRALANRNVDSSDETEDYRQRKGKYSGGKVKEELYIDIKSLFKAFIEESPIHEPDPSLFIIAIEKMFNKLDNFPNRIFLEPVKFHNNLLLRVIF